VLFEKKNFKKVFSGIKKLKQYFEKYFQKPIIVHSKEYF